MSYFYDWDYTKKQKNKWKEQFDSWYSTYVRPSEYEEEVKLFKQRIKEIGRREYMAIHVRVSPTYNVPTFYYQTRYFMDLSPHFVAKCISTEENVEKLVDAMKKLPQKSHEVHSRWIMSFMNGKSGWLSFVRTNEASAFTAVTAYFTWKCTYEDAISHFYFEANEGDWGWTWSSHKFKWGRSVGSVITISDLSTYKKALWLLTTSFRRSPTITKNPSMRSGKKINKKFIEGTDYRPLIERSEMTATKPKIMIIHDCSGSMHHRWIYDTAVSFNAALVNSGVVDVTHVVYHSESGWQDYLPEIKAGQVFHKDGWDEGFQYLDDNLPQDWAREADYVVFTTDLRYDSTNQEGMKTYLSKANKHLVLSFANNSTIKWLNCRIVKDVKDMANAVNTLIG